jgi:hypothetical protein
MDSFSTYILWLYYQARFAVLAPPLYVESAYLYFKAAWRSCQIAWGNFKIKRLRRKLAKLMKNEAA